MSKIQLPKIPFLFFCREDQMEVIVDQYSLKQATPPESTGNHFRPYQGFVVSKPASEVPERIMEIGVSHATAGAAIDALLAGVEYDVENYRDEADPRRHALQALAKAEGVRVVN